ncbi:MAG: hypothetical protein HDQ98_12325 [Lachnospiraceae bacterium]|nr:hypothetical protein [Lachnospiraceae bacterium]
MKWFDLHCDTLTACEEQGLSMRSNTRTQLDFLRLREAGASAQCFAVFLDREACEKRGVSPWRRYEQLRDFFFAALKKNEDAVRPVRTAGELADAERDGAVGAILTVEGGELLGGGAGAENGELYGGGAGAENSGCLDILHARLLRMWEDGVRLLTLTWNYENGLGYPNGSAGGLKRAGYEAVACMQELGMVVDVSHLSDRGFWDVMAAAKKPVTASHSCARSLCGHQRNLTDEQLRAIGKNGGVVGLNFHAPFLKENGVSGSVEEAAYHLRHIISCAGSEAAAFGSDYDGMQGAPEWGGCEGMPRLIEALSSYFDADTMEKICYRNAARLLEQ